MDIQEIQKRVDAIRAGMTAKGLARAKAEFEIKSDAPSRLSLSWTEGTASEWDNTYEFVHGETAEEIFAKTDEFIAGLPSAEETKLHEFMGALGKVIDLGRDRGIDVEFVNPLVATMKRLSENVITDQRAA